MLHVQVSKPSPDSPRQPSLADLSRNASVISSSSSSSSASSLVLDSPRPRPARTFSSPRSRSREPPPTPRAAKPPAYLAKELGLADRDDSYADLKKRAQSRSQSRTKSSRNSSVGLKIQANDFEFGEILGEGSYSTVVHAIYPPTEQEYAIKILDKGHLKRNNKLQTAFAEKNTLVRLGAGHPGIVRLHWALQDEWSLYFVLDLAKNGELQSRISRLGSLSLRSSRYYAAQIVDAVAYMHSKGVIHRDLKPENLLLDDNMRIKITDFGTGKMLDDSIERAGTFVGTAQYVAPELLTTNTTSRASDLWAVGCVIFQMIAGKFPFHALSEYLMWQKVKILEYTFPEGFDVVARDLVEKLLVIDPAQRLGVGEPGTWNDFDALRRHPFFESINWPTLWIDPAPPMEAGLLKKEHPLSEQSNYDVGLAWDQFIGNPGESSDHESHWAESDGEFGSAHTPVTPYSGYPFSGVGGEIGPLDAAPPPKSAAQAVASVDAAETRGRVGLPGPIAGPSSTATLSDTNGRTPAQPVDIPLSDTAPRGSIISSGSTSSSEGSPEGRLCTAAEALALASDRGRDRATTPIQLGAPDASDSDAPWAALLAPGEALVYTAPVELKSRTRRLTATLLPIPATQNRPKIRQLVLTTRRLICAKGKHGRKVVVKSEVLLRSAGAGGAGREGREGKEEKRDTRPVVTNVMPKGQKAFVVLTTAKPQQFVAAEPAIAQRWISEIRSLMRPDEKPQSPTATRSPSPVLAPPAPLLNGLPRT